MAVHEHFHVISGGKSVGETYSEVIRELKGITDTIIVSNPLEEYKEKDREAIEKGFETVRSISEQMKIRYHEPLFYQTHSFQEIIDMVIKLYEEHSSAEFSFNITGGMKIQALALFRVADFMDADAYYVREDTSEVILLSKCRLPAKDIGKNPNIPILLRILDRPDSSDNSKRRVFLRTELKREMEKVYQPIRSRGKEEHILKEGTFSVMLGQLLEWNLIEEGHQNKRNKTYKLKSEGRVMLKLYTISNPK